VTERLCVQKIPVFKLKSEVPKIVQSVQIPQNSETVQSDQAANTAPFQRERTVLRWRRNAFRNRARIASQLSKGFRRGVISSGKV